MYNNKKKIYFFLILNVGLSSMMEDLLACPVCGIFLQEPYIRCFECHNPSRSFCLQCFSKGKEYVNHKNNHSYTVVVSFDYLFILILENVFSVRP